MLTTIGLAIMLGHAFLAGAEPVSDRITVTVKGTGPDVVLIPGLACSTEVWDATVKHLEGHYRIHLVQVAGFAGAPAGGNATGPMFQPTVDAIDAYIKSNKLGAPAVIGHSLGGLMGMRLAIQHPEDTGKLMIVDALPFFCVLFGAQDAAAAEPQAAAMRDQVLNETQDAYAVGEKQFLSRLVKSPAGLAAATKWALASDKSVVARALYDDMTTDLRPQLHDLKTPVTMLYPFDAAMGAPASVDELYHANFAALPNKTLVRIDDSRHFIMLDQPAAFAAQLDKFLGATKTE
jgi:pimeloyl-ACP methyl ester carboxylesterase